MNVAIIALLVLVLVILLGFFRKINVGLLAILAAAILGAFTGSTDKEIIAGFSANLFIMLLGVSFLCAVAISNQSLELLSKKFLRLSGGHAMEQIKVKSLALVLALVLALSLAVPAGAVSDSAVEAAVSDTASYIYNLVKSPQVGSIGGEWAVLGLARSGCSVPNSYYQDYYATVEEYVEACKGVLHEKKYTEYSRVTVALTAIGKDPTNVAGYNLLTPLGDYDKTIWQGMNGPIWALIALDSGNYAMFHPPPNSFRPVVPETNRGPGTNIRRSAVIIAPEREKMGEFRRTENLFFSGWVPCCCPLQCRPHCRARPSPRC